MTFDSYELLLLGDGKIPTRVRSGTVISHLHVQRRIIFFWDRVACQSAASDVWTRTRRKRTGEEEGSRGPRSRREVERGGQSVISSWRGAGPDGIALPVSCLSRHVSWPALPGIASATSMTRSFPVLVPIHASEVAPGLGCPRRHRVSRDPRPVSLVLTSSLPSSLSLSFSPFHIEQRVRDKNTRHTKLFEFVNSFPSLFQISFLFLEAPPFERKERRESSLTLASERLPA